MPIKMTGAQFKAWLASDWGPDACWEEEEVWVNGECRTEGDDGVDEAKIADGDTVEIRAGTIIPNQSAPFHEHRYLDAVRHARAWLKAQNTVTLMVEVPRDRVDGVEGLLKSHSHLKVRRVGA